MAENNDNVKYIVYGSVAIITLGFLYFGIIRPITNKTGLTRDKEDREGDKDQEKIGRKQTLSPLLFNKHKDKVTIGSAKANQLATQVFVGNQPWYYPDDEAKSVGAIQNTGSLVNLSYLSKVFYDKFGTGLETFLGDFLEPRHWDTIDDYITKTQKWGY